MAKPEEKLNQRERITLRLFLWIISILHPWEWAHEQKEFLESIKQELK